MTSETLQGNISILLEGVADFTDLHIARCWTLFFTTFYCVNVCLFLVNTKFPPFDKILRKDANCVSNKLLRVLITVVVSTKDKVYIYFIWEIIHTVLYLSRAVPSDKIDIYVCGQFHCRQRAPVENVPSASGTSHLGMIDIQATTKSTYYVMENTLQL